MSYTDECRRIYTKTAHVLRNTWRGSVNYIKRKLEERKANTEKENPADRAARVTATATKWMAFFTFILAGTSIGTIWILKNQLVEMHDSGIDTHALAQATSDAANAAGDQADAAQQFSDTAEDINGRMSDAVDQLSAAASNAKDGIRATQDATRLDQRAWLGMEEMASTPPTPEVDKVWDVVVTLRNSGKTPAKAIFMWNAEAVLKELPNVNHDCVFATDKKQSTSMLPPGAIYKTILHVANGIKVPTDWEKEITGTGTMYVHGCIVYRDVFGRDHWMTYCGTYDLPHRGSGFLTCEKYNDTGDGKPPE